MGTGSWQWLWHTDTGLLARVAVGVAFFLVLAVWELRRRGREAQRWREYLFLAVATLSAMAYGAINDQVTVTISWEYFYFGKELAGQTDYRQPEESWLRWEAAKIGVKATWTAGLLIGVAVLIANNPRKGTPRLGYRRLYLLIFLVFGIAGAGGLLLGLAGYLGALNGLFREVAAEELLRPRRFLSVWGAHLGGYIGGTIGTALAIWHVLKTRRKLRAEAQKAAE